MGAWGMSPRHLLIEATFLLNCHKTVILSVAPHRFSCDTALAARSRRTPAVLVSRMLLRAFEPLKPAADGLDRDASPGVLPGKAFSNLTPAARFWLCIKANNVKGPRHVGRGPFTGE